MTDVMYDYALFVARGDKGEARRLKTIEFAVGEDDEKAHASAIKALKSAAFQWRANYEPFALANFTICRSPHGANKFAVLLKV